MKTLADVSHLSWFKTELGRNDESTELVELSQKSGKPVKDVKIEGYTMGDNGELIIRKTDGQQFTPDDIAFFKCSVSKLEKTSFDFKFKLLVNFLLQRETLNPTVRRTVKA